MSLRLEPTHWGFQEFPAIYSALKMTNDSLKFYFHILLALKFKIIAVIQILLPLKSQTTVIIQILRALKFKLSFVIFNAL